MADEETSGTVVDLEDLEAEPLEQLQIAAPPRAEAEVRPGGDRLGPDRPQVALGEHLGLERHQLRRERRDQRRLDPGVCEQLQPPLERGDQLDVVPERDARVRIERDHRRREARVDRSLDDAPVAAVDAVEGADRDRARLPLELGRRVGDPHRPPTPSARRMHRGGCFRPSLADVLLRLPVRSAAPSDRRSALGLRLGDASSPMRPSASSSGSTCSASASSTENGPTSVRRRVDAVAAERIGDRPDVGAGADTQIERRDALCIRDDVERVDPRAPQGHLDDDALPVQAVGALTPDLDGRRRRDRKLDLAAEVRERGFETAGRGRLVQLERLALGVARGRPPREVDVREIALRQPDEA